MGKLFPNNRSITIFSRFGPMATLPENRPDLFEALKSPLYSLLIIDPSSGSSVGFSRRVQKYEIVIETIINVHFNSLHCVEVKVVPTEGFSGSGVGRGAPFSPFFCPCNYITRTALLWLARILLNPSYHFKMLIKQNVIKKSLITNKKDGNKSLITRDYFIWGDNYRDEV